MFDFFDEDFPLSKKQEDELRKKQEAESKKADEDISETVPADTGSEAAQTVQPAKSEPEVVVSGEVDESPIDLGNVTVEEPDDEPEDTEDEDSELSDTEETVDVSNMSDTVKAYHEMLGEKLEDIVGAEEDAEETVEEPVIEPITVDNTVSDNILDNFDLPPIIAHEDEDEDKVETEPAPKNEWEVQPEYFEETVEPESTVGQDDKTEDSAEPEIAYEAEYNIKSEEISVLENDSEPQTIFESKEYSEPDGEQVQDVRIANESEYISSVNEKVEDIEKINANEPENKRKTDNVSPDPDIEVLDKPAEIVGNNNERDEKLDSESRKVAEARGSEYRYEGNYEEWGGLGGVEETAAYGTKKFDSIDEMEAHLHEELKSLGEKLDSMEKVVDGMEDGELPEGFEYEYDEQYFSEEDTPAFKHSELYGKDAVTGEEEGIKRTEDEYAPKITMTENKRFVRPVTPIASKKPAENLSFTVSVNKGTLVKAGLAMAATALIIGMAKRKKK